MNRFRLAAVAACAGVGIAGAGCGKSATKPDSAQGSSAPTSTSTLTATTAAATGETGRVTWATYRAVTTVDPIQAFDYPENTVITSMCESLLRQQPDGAIAPGLAEKVDRPDPKTLVLTLRGDVAFWNGRSLTPDDVVFSLKRAADAEAGSFYAPVFARVRTVEATGAREVTIKLSKPDYWLDRELSQMPGIVYEKAYAERKGKTFGTPAGGTMCTGAFKLESWRPGAELTAVRNDAYWDASARAKAQEISFKGVPDDASMTSGLLTGAIDGSYITSYSSLKQLEAGDAVTLTEGPSFATDALVVSNAKGPLGDVRVRRALSLAVDHAGYVSTVYQGRAMAPRTLANPGTWGYGQQAFEADWERRPDPKQDLAEAKRLLEGAGAVGKTIVIGSTAEVAVVNSNALAIREAGRAIGLKVKLKAVSAQTYINFFTDAKFRATVDGFPTVNYPDAADPALFYATFALPGGIQNYSGFSDRTITGLLERARATANPDARAKLVAQAGARISEQLPWIPMALPHTILALNRELTGAPASFVFMGGPWAHGIGKP